MKKITKFFLVFSSLSVSSAYFLVPSAYAFCPVCIVAVGAGLGLSRYLGVSDAVSGIWVGGLLLASSLWLVDWLVKKIKKLQSINLLVLQVSSALLTYAVVLIPLWHTGVIGHPFNKIWGIDKLIFGTVIGTILFIEALWLDKMERKIKGKQLFDFQKVVFPVVSLLIGSLVMYFITKK